MQLNMVVGGKIYHSTPKQKERNKNRDEECCMVQYGTTMGGLLYYMMY